MVARYPEGPFSQRLDSTIDRARSGDSTAARKVLEWYCGGVMAYTKNGTSLITPSGCGIKIDDRILRYLGQCFQAILRSAVSADVALGLRKKPHREPSASIAERDERIALEMAMRLANGETRKEACFCVATSWEKHESFNGRSNFQIQDTVRKAYDKRKNTEVFKLKIRMEQKCNESFWKQL
jgi:hypothetical protein